MLKIKDVTKVWASMLCLFLMSFLVPGTSLAGSDEELGPINSEPPQCGHNIYKSPPNPPITLDPLGSEAFGVMFDEDLKMADVTIYVSTQEELYEALKNASGGETILLASGEYGNISLRDLAHSAPVAIRSADPEDQAVFTGLILRDSQGLSISDVEFVYDYKFGDPQWVAPFQLIHCSNVTIEGSSFTGDIAAGVSEVLDGYGWGAGLKIGGSTDIRILNNVFDTFANGIGIGRSENISIIGNDITGIRTDGINIAEVSNVLIESNRLHDFDYAAGSGDHSDFIQLISTSDFGPSSNIVIRSNVIDAVDKESPIQAIFMRNGFSESVAGDPAAHYRNILIEENVIRVGTLHGVNVGATDGLEIRNNSLFGFDGSNTPPTIRIAPNSTNVTVASNIVSSVYGESSEQVWSIYGNGFIQYRDQNAPDYYQNFVVWSSMFSEGGVADYRILESSMFGQLKIGASTLFARSSHEGATLFQIYSSTNDANELVFDAGPSVIGDGLSLPSDIVYIWSVDGSVVSNLPLFRTTIDTPGIHEIDLLLESSDGVIGSAKALVDIPEPQLFEYNRDLGIFVNSDSAPIDSIVENHYLSPADQQAISLSQTGVAAKVGRDTLERLYGAEKLTIDFALQSTIDGTFGEVFRLHDLFVAKVGKDGRIEFGVKTSDSAFHTIVGAGIAINDGEHHLVSISFDAYRSSLTLLVDGVINSEVNLKGSLAGGGGKYDLVFGNPWSGSNFVGTIDSFSVSVENNILPFYSTYNAHIVEELPLLTDYQDSPSNMVSVTEDLADSRSALSGDHLSLFDDRGNVTADFALIGDASVVLDGNRSLIALDGKKDAISVLIPDGLDYSDSLEFEIGFIASSFGSMPTGLIETDFDFAVLASEDSLTISFGAAHGKRDSISLDLRATSLLDGNEHLLEFSAVRSTGHVTVVLDNSIVFDEAGLQFSLSSDNQDGNWWKKGWQIGTGDRRSDDFEGYISHFAVGDVTMFVDL